MVLSFAALKRPALVRDITARRGISLEGCLSLGWARAPKRMTLWAWRDSGCDPKPVQAAGSWASGSQGRLAVEANKPALRPLRTSPGRAACPLTKCPLRGAGRSGVALGLLMPLSVWRPRPAAAGAAR